MAQVNSEPGVSQVPTTVVVPNTDQQPGALSKLSSYLTTVVPYSQNEPGKHDAKRS
jgi:hypothetical protein